MHHRVMIAGTASGSGKTTITCGILKALMKANKKVQPFKCGPDFVDPMFHEYITNTSSYNLDKFFVHRDTINWILQKHSLEADISIIEGVMGLYDGIGISTEGSTFEIAKVTNTPIILVVNAKGMVATVVALIKGLMNYEAGNLIQGIILNRCSKSMFDLLKLKIEDELKVNVIGYVPIAKEMVIDSKNLSLSILEDEEELDKKLNDIHKLISDTIDIEEVIRISKLAPEISYKRPTFLKKIESFQNNKTIRIAVAKDNAFHFYYKDNLDLFEMLGAEIVTFSPITDKRLPDNVHIVYLGGGHIENCLQQLSQNGAMKESIYNAFKDNVIFIAECGGYMYLSNSITDIFGNTFQMVGAIPHNISLTKRLNPNFGYVTMTSNNASALGKMNLEIKAHVLHYSRSDEVTEGFNVTRPTGKQWRTAIVDDNLYAGFPQLYFYSNVDAILYLLKKTIAKIESEENHE